MKTFRFPFSSDLQRESRMTHLDASTKPSAGSATSSRLPVLSPEPITWPSPTSPFSPLTIALWLATRSSWPSISLSWTVGTRGARPLCPTTRSWTSRVPLLGPSSCTQRLRRRVPKPDFWVPIMPHCLFPKIRHSINKVTLSNTWMVDFHACLSTWSSFPQWSTYHRSWTWGKSWTTTPPWRRRPCQSSVPFFNLLTIFRQSLFN